MDFFQTGSYAYWFDYLWIFQTGSYYIAQAGLELTVILLPSLLSAGIMNTSKIPGFLFCLIIIGGAMADVWPDDNFVESFLSFHPYLRAAVLSFM